MRKLIFKRLVILSESEKKANQYTFSPTRNLISANDNSLGKSYLAKMLFWSLGCELVFDEKWKNFDIKSVVQFSVDDQNFQIGRYKKFMYVTDNNGSTTFYSKITGDYAKAFADIVGSGILFSSKNRETDELDTPPPAFYFLPFYVDQKKGWVEAWNSFENLGQYDAHQRKKLIKYFTGYIKDEQWDFELDQAQIQISKKEVQGKIDKIDATMHTFEEYLPPAPIIDDENELEKALQSIEGDLAILKMSESKFLDEFTNLHSQKADLQLQIQVVENSISELDHDYEFVLTHSDSGQIECPTCGVIHDNRLLNKSDILIEQDKCGIQLEQLLQELERLDDKIDSQQMDLSEIRNRIKELNGKYKSLELDKNTLISFAATKVREKISAVQGDFIVKREGFESDHKAIQKEIKKLYPKYFNDDRNTFFLQHLISNLNAIGVTDENLSNVKSPLDYKKVNSIGGAAEQSRALFAYYLTIIEMIQNYSTIVHPPFVVDTPNQHEQADFNYESIIQRLMEVQGCQVILCAMENDILNEYKKGAKTIFLDDKKLLSENSFENLSKEFESVFRNKAKEAQ